MFYHQTFRIRLERLVLGMTIVMLVIANQGPFLPTTAFAQSNSTNTTVKQSKEQSERWQQGALSTSSSITQPIIFVHGFFENAHDMGTRDFVPLYSALRAVFGNDSIRTFYYLDDEANADGTDPKLSCSLEYTPCLSRSSEVDNAVKLAQMTSTIYQETQHKVTLIGYSMGAAIIRTALAGCPIHVTCQKTAAMVNNVFFIEGVQQGSWLAQVYHGTTLSATLSFLQAIKAVIAKAFWGRNINANAEEDLRPQSPTITSKNTIALPNNIHYFNFYGDITLLLTIPNLFSSTVVRIDIGDGVILPVLTTVYNCAQIKLTVPRDGGSLWEMPFNISAGDRHDQEQDSEQDTRISRSRQIDSRHRDHAGDC